MAEPFLDLGDICLVVESVRGGRRAQRVHTKTLNLGADAGFPRIFADDVLQDRAAVERLLKFARTIIYHGTEHGAGGIGAVAGQRQVFLNEAPWHGRG